MILKNEKTVANKVMSIVREILGDNATGVYIHHSVVTRDLFYDQAPLTSTLGECPFIIEDTKHFKVFYGATKLCIYPCNRKIKWVIKIPITGVYNPVYEFGLSGVTEEDWQYEPTFSKLEDAGIANYDSCDEEIAIYENSTSDAQNYMSPNILIGRYNNIPIYIQEKVYTCEAGDSYTFSTFDYKEGFLRHEIDYLYDLNTNFEDDAFFYNIILRSGVQKALEVISELGDIDDIHQGNYGYNYEGKPVIFDYAGYFTREHYTLKEIDE